MTVLSTALSGAKWMAYFGLACGILYAFGGLIMDLNSTGVNRGTALAFLALIGMPAMFAALGFICCALYGLIASGLRKT